MAEANVCWASGLCDRREVLPVLRRASAPEAGATGADRRWSRESHRRHWAAKAVVVAYSTSGDGGGR